MRDIRMMQHAAAEQAELRELDAEIAILMGWTDVTNKRMSDGSWTGKTPPSNTGAQWIDDVPFVTTDDAAAFAAVDWMRERGWTFCLYDYLIVESIPTDQKWQAIFIGKGISPACSASTRPLAIARAVKKALR